MEISQIEKEEKQLYEFFDKNRGRRDNFGINVTPFFVCNFFKEFIKKISPKTILDPAGGLGVLLRIILSEVSTIEKVKTIEINNEIREKGEELSKGFNIEYIQGNGEEILPTIEESFDMVIGDIPRGMRSNKEYGGMKIDLDIILMLQSLEKLKSGGFGLFTNTNNFHIKWYEKIYPILEKMGVSLLGNIGIPPNTYLNTSIQSNILIFGKEIKGENLFISELSKDSNIEKIIDNFKNTKDSGSIVDGTYIKPKSFFGFSNYKTKKQIEKLQTQYKDFQSLMIKDVVNEINTTKDNFNDIENSLYIPTIGNQQIVLNVDDIEKKHHNFLQIVLKSELVSNEFLKIYFESDIGKLSLESLKKDSFIPKITKGDFEKLSIPFPSITKQIEIIRTSSKIEKVDILLEKVKRELSLNPNNTNILEEKLDDLLSSFGELSKGDRILSLIRNGESKTVEFKETFSKCLKTKKKEKYIKESSLKNIVGFLNSNGGSLLIGVDDEGNIKGIEDDFYQNNDKYLLNFKNSIKEHIGEEFYPLIDYTIIEVSNKKVLLVECEISKEPCFLDKEKFYVRTNPSADELKGKKQFEYINNHFKKS